MRVLTGIRSATLFLGICGVPIYCAAADSVGSDLVFVPETQINARDIVGYYQLPSVSQRAVGDGFEYQAIRDADGQLAVEVKPVRPEEQRYFLPLGRFNPNQIIIGKPPFPELEGAKVIRGEPPKHLLNKSPLLMTTPWGTEPILDGGARAILGGGTEATQAGMTYQPLASSFSLSYSHSLATVYGTAVLPYPEMPGSPLQKPAGTNHQWISFDFVASNYFSNASGQTAGSHVPIVMYRWSQFSAYAITPPNTYVGYDPFIGTGAFFGDNSGSAGVGCGNPSAPGASKPKDNATLERYSRLRNTANEAFNGEGYVSPYGCGTHQLMNNRQYRLILLTSDGGWAAYYLYLNIAGTWYQVATYTEQVAPPGSTPGGSFNNTMGGIAITATSGTRDFSFNFTNVQWGAYFN